MTIVVLSLVKKLIAFWILLSVSASKEDVASSSKIIELFFKIALAMDNLCFSPPDSLIPFSPIKVSYFPGNLSINSLAKENFAASTISLSDASKLAYAILFLIVSSKSVVSWLTKEIFFLTELIVDL